jgi:hypothetical protein
MAPKRVAESWRKVKNKKTGATKKVKVKAHFKKPKKPKTCGEYLQKGPSHWW